MLEIDCRKCLNCDKENDCCRLYGKDPRKAVAKCASDEFWGYQPVSERGAEND